MRVKLASCGNPDYFQDPDAPLYGCEKNHYLVVKTLEEAAKACEEFIARNSLGSGNWAGGEIFDGDKIIAKVAYNGRLIYVSDQSYCSKILFTY